MSPYDTPTALAILTGIALFTLGWAVWVARDVAQARRARRRTPGTRSQVNPPCHVTGCPYPGFVTLSRTTHHGTWEVMFMCHGHADETSVKGAWMRERGWREVVA